VRRGADWRGCTDKARHATQNIHRADEFRGAILTIRSEPRWFVDNSSREQPEWSFSRRYRVLRCIAAAAEGWMLGFRGMRGEQALRSLSDQLLPSCRQRNPVSSSQKTRRPGRIRKQQKTPAPRTNPQHRGFCLLARVWFR
jgi:hypothetical protein